MPGLLLSIRKERMHMQLVSMQDKQKRTPCIEIDIGRYHFIAYDGWREEWQTKTPREWWEKQKWLKDGGYKQDES